MDEEGIARLYDEALNPIYERICALHRKKKYVQGKWTWGLTLRMLMDPTTKETYKKLARIIKKLDLRVEEQETLYNNELGKLNEEHAPKQLTQILESEVPASYYGWKAYDLELMR